MSDLMKRKSPPSPVDKHRAAIGAGNYNRFLPLVPRSRLPSVKRMRTSDTDYSSEQAKVPKLDAQVIFTQLGEHDKCMGNAKEALECAATAIKVACKVDDGGMGTAVSKLYSAVEQLIQGSELLKSTLIDLCNKKGENPISNPHGNQKVSTITNSDGPGPDRTRKGTTAANPPSLESKVKKALRDAERKMVIFDLNLGSAPIINKKTISEKVTVSLHTKAGEARGQDWNQAEAATMVDDVLSCANLEFLGSGTRTFYNNRDKDDPRNKKFCTVPVRFEFQTKETRIQAEQALRRVCKVSPSVPYPKKIRSMLADTVKRGKDLHPNTFIRTKIDIDQLTIKAMVKVNDKWTDIKELTQAIPLDSLDRNNPADIAELDSDMEVFTQVIASEVSQASL